MPDIIATSSRLPAELVISVAEFQLNYSIFVVLSRASLLLIEFQLGMNNRESKFSRAWALEAITQIN